MRVGVPAEVKANEHRVGLTPASVRELTARGHDVLIERGAGAGAGYDDEAYVRAGGEILGAADEVFRKSGLIVKVKEPQPEEWALLRQGQIVFTYLHLAPDPEQAHGLLRSGCSAIAYETVTDDAGGLPLLAPMSEVAGRIAIFAAAGSLLKHNGGRGVLLSGATGVQAARVCVIGGGVVGLNAARMAAGLNASVVVLERSVSRLRALDEMFLGRMETRYSTQTALEEEVLRADVVIGAVLAPGAAAPKLLSRDLVKRMRPGAVLVDVSIDQGGCFETSRPTTHAEPTFEVEGVVHYCVANMPGAAPRTASEALSNVTLPFAVALADQGLDALSTDRHLARGLNIHEGAVTHPAVARSLGVNFTDSLSVWS